MPPVAEEVAVKSNVNVRIGAFPGGKIKPYQLPSGTTYAEALTAAGISAKGEVDLRVNGGKASNLQGVVNENDQILVFSNVRGN